MIRISGREYTVVGVAPAGFAGVDLETANGIPDVWVALSMAETAVPEFAGRGPLTSSGIGWLQIVGRLTPG